MSIVLQGSTSGSVTLQEPAVAGTTVLDLPAVSGTVLTTGSSGQSIPKAALPTGSVLQVVSSNYGTYPTSTTSSSFVTTGHTLSITPTSATSKIYLVLHFQTIASNSGQGGGYTIYRNGSNLNNAGFAEQNTGSAWVTMAITYLDSPATTSAITYAVYYKLNGSGTLYYCGNTNELCVLTAMEIAA